MNQRQKREMHDHYTALGWSYNDIIRYGTQDKLGKRPCDIESKSDEKSTKSKKSKK